MKSNKTPNIKIPGLTIMKKLAQGGQGEIFVIQKNGKELVLKLYFEKESTADQRQIIEELIRTGPPKTPGRGGFVWPMEIVETPDGKRFGYIMPLIQISEYISLGHIEAGQVRHPGYAVLVEACRQLAEMFRILHIDGFCYRDISKFNVMFSPKTGDVVICDNDNVIVNKHGPGKIKGTTPYMAPEVILGKARPSTATDQHSLAVLLFMILFGGHPFHGAMEDNIHIFDRHAAEYIYGHKPVFVFDPNNSSNRLPDEPGYLHVKVQWNIFPRDIHRLFTRVFTSGLRSPADRVTDMEWMAAFTRLQGCRHVCSCRAENFWDPNLKIQRPCWNKGCTVDYPDKLIVQGKSTTAMLVKLGHQISSFHLGEKSSSRIVGQITKHPKDAKALVLKNESSASWYAGKVEIPAGRGVLLRPGLRIKADRHEFIVSS